MRLCPESIFRSLPEQASPLEESRRAVATLSLPPTALFAVLSAGWVFEGAVPPLHIVYPVDDVVQQF